VSLWWIQAKRHERLAKNVIEISLELFERKSRQQPLTTGATKTLTQLIVAY
jgi:hypothetical protein